MNHDYKSKGVQFYYVYKSLAHPENNGYIAPITLKERLMHVSAASSQLKTKIPWLCDSMNNDLKHALGDAPNSEFIIGPDGKIVATSQWNDPDKLRDKLAELVGESTTQTSSRDLDLGSISAPKTSAKGIVPRLEVPAGMMAAQVTPIERRASNGSVQPYYVKLRAEFDQNREQLYLGFFLDPLHKVHWNNLAEPIEFSIEAQNGLTVTPESGIGPTVETPADADPREFLVRLNGDSDKPLKLTVRYFACDDADRFCKAVTQEYTIVLQRDTDGGSRRSSSGRGRGGSGRSRNGRPSMAGSPGMTQGRGQQSGRIQDPLTALLDTDGDGELSINEIDASIPALRKLDADGDGNVTIDEIRRSRSATGPRSRER